MIEVDYPVLGSAIRSLNYKQLLNFYCVFNYFQNKCNNLCKKEGWEEFNNLLPILSKKLSNKEISYKEFRSLFSSSIEKMVFSYQIDKVVMLVRESYNYKNINDLLKVSVKIFN